MSTTTEAKPWDFSQVLDLVNSLSFASGDTHDGYVERRPDYEKCASNEKNDLYNEVPAFTEKGQSGLGDFSRLWQYLGSPPSLLAPVADITLQSESDTAVLDNAAEAHIHDDTAVFKAAHSSTEEQPADTGTYTYGYSQSRRQSYDS